MFGRRVAVLLRVPVPARLPQTIPLPAQHELPLRTLFYRARRTYATPGRPRSVVGEPSSTVKRSAKRAAAKVTSSNSPAKQKTEAKKKEAAKKKAAPKKAPVKKQLTEAQKAVKAAKTESAKIAELKKAALDPPVIPNANAYVVFTREKGRDFPAPGKGLPPAEVRQKMGARGEAMGAAWKDLSTADIEHYNHLARTAKEDAQAEYKRWVESHSPEVIHEANKARAQLRRRLPSEKKRSDAHRMTQWSDIKDERATKRPLSAFVQFSINRNASGDFRNIRVAERAKLIGQEWKALSEDEKNKYKTLEKQEHERYGEEYSSVYGHPPPSAQPAVAAAAA